jgi:hypothetical protein
MLSQGGAMSSAECRGQIATHKRKAQTRGRLEKFRIFLLAPRGGSAFTAFKSNDFY